MKATAYKIKTGIYGCLVYRTYNKSIFNIANEIKKQGYSIDVSALINAMKMPGRERYSRDGVYIEEIKDRKNMKYLHIEFLDYSYHTDDLSALGIEVLPTRYITV